MQLERNIYFRPIMKRILQFFLNFYVSLVLVIVIVIPCPYVAVLYAKSNIYTIWRLQIFDDVLVILAINRSELRAELTQICQEYYNVVAAWLFNARNKKTEHFRIHWEPKRMYTKCVTVKNVTCRRKRVNYLDYMSMYSVDNK